MQKSHIYSSFNYSNGVWFCLCHSLYRYVRLTKFYQFMSLQDPIYSFSVRRARIISSLLHYVLFRIGRNARTWAKEIRDGKRREKRDVVSREGREQETGREGERKGKKEYERERWEERRIEDEAREKRRRAEKEQGNEKAHAQGRKGKNIKSTHLAIIIYRFRDTLLHIRRVTSRWINVNDFIPYQIECFSMA